MTTNLIARAETLARHLHAAQTDKRGRPYVEHLEAVVGILLRRWPDAPEEAVAAAWLHDVLEDTDVSFPTLLELGRDVLLLVDSLTRWPAHRRTSYLDWIGLIADGPIWAIRIKLADLEHNSDPARAIPGSDIVERRYAPARAVLEEALGQRERVG